MNSRRPSVYVAYATLLLVIIPFGYLYLVQGMRFFRVPSESMLPTLEVADYLLTFPEEEYKPGDVVVLMDPENDGQYIVKRVVGLPAQTVKAQGGGLFIDGRYVSEPYLNEPMSYDMADYTVPEGMVFVLGDNRNASQDSHNWDRDATNPKDRGKPMALPQDRIVGKVVNIYLPFNRIRRVESYPLDQLRAS